MDLTPPADAWRPRLRAALVAAAGLAGFLACLVPLRDPDAFHLMAFGREVVRGGGLPATEPFLWPLQGQPCGAASWLTSVVLYLSTTVAGLAGPPVLAALLAGAAVALVAADATDERPGPAGLLLALAPLAPALAVLRLRAAPRPELVAYLGVALTAWSIRRLDAGRRGLLLAFPLLALVWTNAHQSVVLGVGLLWLAALAAAVLPPRTAAGRRDLRPALLLSAAGAGGLLAGLVNPDGPAPFVAAVRLVLLPLGLDPGGEGGALAWVGRAVTELQPLGRAEWLGPLGLLTALALLGAAAGFRRTTPRDLLLAAAGLALAATARRHVGFAALLLAPVAGRHLARAAARLPSRVAGPVAAAAALAVLAGGVGSIATGPTAGFGVALSPGAFPVRAVRYLAEHGLRGRLFNRFETGGYLEWTLGLPVFQDGRGALKPEDAAVAVMEAGHLAAFERLDARYHFDALLLGRPELDQAMEALSRQLGPGRDLAADRTRWALVAFDDGGLLYLRRDGPLAALVARDEYRFAIPANPLLPDRYQDPALRGGIIADLTRAVAEAPACRTCRVALGWALSLAGRHPEVEEVVTPALGGRDETEYLALQLLGLAAAERGDRRQARQRYREVLALGAGDDRVTRRNLALLALADGDLAEASAMVGRNLADDPRSAPDLELEGRVEAARRGSR